MLISLHPFASLCNELIDSEAERSLSPKVGYCSTELGKRFMVCLFLVSLYHFLVVLCFTLGF